jgi:RsiW-degrading membrane proteinase PrsW (M82 family)
MPILSILIGMFAVFPATFIQLLFPEMFFAKQTLLTLLFSSLVYIALVEEVCKTVCLFLVPNKNLSITSFFALSFLVGYSFGSFENIIYIFKGVTNPILRMLTSCVIHSVCTGTAAFFVWFLRKKKFHLTLILTPIFVHGLYDFFAGFPGKFWLVSIIVIFYGIFQCGVFYQMFKNDEKIQ